MTYWNTVINTCEPDLLVFYTWPHTPSCYALYLICKHYYNIDVLFIDPNPLLNQDYHLIGNSVENLSNPLDIVIKDPLKINYDNKNHLSLEDSDTSSINVEPKHILSDFDMYENSENYFKRFNSYYFSKIKLSNIPKIYNKTIISLKCY